MTPPKTFILACVLAAAFPIRGRAQSPAPAAPAKTYEEAYKSVYDAARSSLLSSSPRIWEALDKSQLQLLSSPDLRSAAEPGARREKTAELLSAIGSVAKLQGVPGFSPASPEERFDLFSQGVGFFGLSDAEGGAASRVYFPDAPQGAGAASGARPPADALAVQQRGLANADAAVQRAALAARLGLPAGTVDDLTAAAGGPGRSLTAADIARLNAIPESSSIHLKTSADVPSPNAGAAGAPGSFIFEQSRLADQAVAGGDAAVESRFARDYAADDNAIADSARYWQDRQNADIRPGEGAAGYVWRRTSATVMGSFLSPISNFREAVARLGYTDGSVDASGGAKRKAALYAAGDTVMAGLALAPGVGATTKVGAVATESIEGISLAARRTAVAGVSRGATEADEFSRALEVGAGDDAAAAALKPGARPGVYDIRARYTAATRDARSGAISQTTMTEGEIGVKQDRIASILDLDHQKGMTCARNGLTACAIVNSKELQSADPQAVLADVERKSQAATIEVEEARIGRLEGQLAAGNLTAKEQSGIQVMLDFSRARIAAAREGGAAHQAYGLTTDQLDRTIGKMGWTSEGAASAEGPLKRLSASLSGRPNAPPVEEAFREFAQASDGVKASIDAELGKGNGVLTAIYTGVKDGDEAGTVGRHTYHAVTVLRKSTNIEGEPVYVIYDSNVPGTTTVVREADFYPYRAQVVRSGT